MNSFRSYIDIFRQPRMLDTLTLEIIEDTDKDFEINVTECLSYDVYKAQGFAGKFGFAIVCYGDYAWAEGYNPQIKLIRDKTLMEGHGLQPQIHLERLTSFVRQQAEKAPR